MEKIYLLKLLKQFHEADGITNLKELDNGFLTWLKEYQKILLELKNYYDFIGIPIDDDYSYEMGKGLLDSIILDKSHSISSYGEKKSELIIFENQPLVVSKLGIKELQGGNLFYTYNPYTTQDLDLMLKILQIGEPISVSMCGKNFDNDKQQKLKTLSELFMKFELSQNYEESGDNYFYTLYTPRKVKVKTLTR
ncbi:MAG: hypothetical protein Q4E75_02695 [bacterium]|nr:hypothetical protein [bacterium]